jgi:hypothetical protein
MPIPVIIAAKLPSANPRVLNRSNLNIGCFTLFSIKGNAMSVTVPIIMEEMTHGLSPSHGTRLIWNEAIGDSYEEYDKPDTKCQISRDIKLLYSFRRGFLQF